MSASPKTLPPAVRRKLLALALSLATMMPSAALARTSFNSLLELDLAIVEGAIENKFGFATSFPRPENAPRFGDKNKNPGGDEKLRKGGGGTAILSPGNLAAAVLRKSVDKGRGMRIRSAGTTNAILRDDSFGQAERWITGRTRFRLGNFTGRPGLPAAQPITINLDFDVTRQLHAEATNDVAIADRANAKAIYSLKNTTDDAFVVPETMFVVDDDDSRARQEIGFAKTDIATAPITIPAASFVELDLMGHVYGAGESRGSEPPHAVPVVPPAGSIPNFRDRMDQPFPDDGMRLQLASTALFGDVNAFGQVMLASVAGVTGDDPLALHGVNSIYTDQVLHNVDSFFDIAYEVEVPVNNAAPVALEERLVAPGGTHTMMIDMQLGTGVGEHFQLSQDPFMLGLDGPEAELPPQELTGAYQLMNINDPFVASQMLFQGQMQPGQLSQFEMLVNVHDLVDGVIDGMARFTLRKFVEGFGGDYDGNFLTDQGDLALWQQLYGTEDFLADGNANGIVDGGDFLKWQQNLGRGGFPFENPPVAITAVPEPASVMLLLLGASAIAVGYRGERR